MERLKIRLFIIAGIFAITGAILAFAKPDTSTKTETWMEDQAPMTVGPYEMLPSRENPKQSYKMNESTYKTLQPFGIVSRIYEHDGKRYDAVIIASRSKDSFHDPRVCFTAQGWALLDQRQASVHTQTRGDVPITLATMQGNGVKKTAAFSYKGPDGFHATTRGLKLSMFLEVLKFGDNIDGIFYRFIPNSDGVTDEELLDFIALYLDEANRSSNGYF